MAKDLRHFLDRLKGLGPDCLVEVSKPVDPVYELSVLQQKLAKMGKNPVILFRRVHGSSLPVVTNLFGSYTLLGLALDVPLENLVNGQYHLILEEYRRRQARPIPPITVKGTDSPVRQVLWRDEEVDLSRLPIAKHAILNAGKYIDAGLTILKHPDTGRINVGIYRQQVLGPKQLACMIVPTHHGNIIARRYAELGRTMPVVVAIGHHPATLIAAGSARPAETEDELALIGGLLGEPLETTSGITVDLPVPANAEIVIEGNIDPRQLATEGPFSEGAGYYGEARPCFVINITAITMRRDAIYHDVHPTHAEHNLIGILQREIELFDRVKAAGIDVRAVHIGPEGQCGKLLMYVSITKHSPDDARIAGQAAVNHGFAKAAIIVDDDVDVYDQSEVLWALATRPGKVFTVPTDTTPSNLQGRPDKPQETHRLTLTGPKLIIDATFPLGATNPVRVVPPEAVWQRVQIGDYLTSFFACPPL